MTEQSDAVLERVSRDMKAVREMLTQVLNKIIEAETEIPEKMRRFVMYMHDVHDISYLYEERGHPVPAHILRELERCDDRFRQLLKDLHLDGGAFEKIRREMANDPHNKWDHTRLLGKPEGATK